MVESRIGNPSKGLLPPGISDATLSPFLTDGNKSTQASVNISATDDSLFSPFDLFNVIFSAFRPMTLRSGPRMRPTLRRKCRARSLLAFRSAINCKYFFSKSSACFVGPCPLASLRRTAGSA